jgi:hydrogenase-4 component J
MREQTVFYQLNAKFLERADDIPDDAKQIVYYSLTIGHHIGVFDCFKPILTCSNALYDRVLTCFSESGTAHRKLSGLCRFGEITIDSSHTRMLKDAIADALPGVDSDATEWLCGLHAALDAIDQEPVMYLMGKRR